MSRGIPAHLLDRIHSKENLEIPGLPDGLGTHDLVDEILRQRDVLWDAKDEALRKAWDSLSRYKFLMFGYHAAQWVLLNRVSYIRESSPFTDLVKFASRRK